MNQIRILTSDSRFDSNVNDDSQIPILYFLECFVVIIKQLGVRRLSTRTTVALDAILDKLSIDVQN